MSRLCTKGWIGTYVDYTQNQQSPTCFHLWTSLATIAAIMGRRTWIDRGFYTLYPNLYIILVAPSGVGCKSTALNIGVRNFLVKANPTAAVMQGKLTIPYLIDFMASLQNKNPKANAEVTIVCGEFKTFAQGIQSDSGLIADLTHIYDCPDPWEYRSKGQGIYTIPRVCVNLFAASTPEWLTTGSAADFIGGGFSSRIIPVALQANEREIAWPTKSQAAKELEDKLVEDLKDIAKLDGPFLVIQEARDYFEDWYKNRNKLMMNDQRMAGFYSKKHDMVLKVAMALSASASSDMVVTKEHIHTALALFVNIEKMMPFAYQGVAWSEESKFHDKIIAEIAQKGEISHTDLMKSFRYCVSGEDMKKILATLIDTDEIGYRKEGSTGRQKMIYFIKP